jgi:RNA polymerase sigma-70 factor (ECF subfamily)
MDPAPGFAILYRQHAGPVFRLAWLLSGDRTEAEDLTSEAFARALAGIGRIRQDSVRSYLYAIVRNELASRRRRPAVELAVEPSELESAVDPEPGPEQRAALRQALARAGAALARLREPERQVLLLSGLHGLSVSEIGDALGLAPGHVRVRLHRARRSLGALLPDLGEPHGLA